MPPEKNRNEVIPTKKDTIDPKMVEDLLTKYKNETLISKLIGIKQELAAKMKTYRNVFNDIKYQIFEKYYIEENGILSEMKEEKLEEYINKQIKSLENEITKIENHLTELVIAISNFDGVFI
ncbi:hypothetical protein EDEG_02001 [Edhazardia aedis USNM 41457]|uniref:Uncharacterized protein n=1 Tax=Edhazardia aedis (strain USNM 41457) TaxID=1003232 RepID=J9D877_EDHAE|nr:hypothetical protein EDEG_02001 [Edhazardia aedis USNM 41457]|eukprot:EJW03709.1 hypothetical protein EDEG_02001 [Edhazardia aedis USNM 41457]